MNLNHSKLKYIARLRYGDALSPNESDREGEFEVFGSNGIYSRNDYPNTFGPTIVVGRKGSYGKVNWSPISCFASDTTFFIDSRSTQHNLRWLFYTLQSLNLDVGSNETAVPGLSREDVYNQYVWLPSPCKQQSIADFLDRETAYLDALIAAKERLLKLLDEKRRALITHAVTRGLDPDVKLRDSGVEWLGEIPVHWNVERLKFHLKKIEQGWSPQCDNFPATEGEWGVLKVGAVNGWIFNPDENKRLPEEEEPIEEYEIKFGDILMSRANTTELLGSVAIVQTNRSKLLLCDKLYRLILTGNNLLSEFLVYFLRSVVGRFQFERDATGASNSMQNIGQDSVCNAWIVVPPVNEQKKIALYIETETKKLDNLKSATERTINLLKERRTALISAAVTGQLAIGTES